MNLSEAFGAAFPIAVRWFLPALAAFCGIQSLLVPGSRRKLLGVLLLGACGAAVLAVSSLLLMAGASPEAASFRGIRALGDLLLWIGAINSLGVLVFAMVLPSLRVPLPPLLSDLVLAAAYVAATLTVISEAGANVTGLLATSAVVTAILAFSLQETLGNLMGGMVLHLEQSFVPGDWIRLGNEEGQVKEIRWRQTTLEHYSGNTIVIPNSAVMKGVVTVFGARIGGNRYRLRQVDFNVYYDRPPTEVIAAVEKALREDPPPTVASVPPAMCVLTEFKPSHAVYAARYFLKDLSRPDPTDAEVRLRIYYALARVGTKLSIPQRSLVVLQQDEHVQQASRGRETERRMKALRGVGIFSALTEDEVTALAPRLLTAPFAKGELLTRQGAVAHWLYVLVDGEAEVHVGNAEGSLRRAVARLGAGSVMGEMSLLTGEPRSATVVAVTDMLCYRLDREAFKDILSSRPEIADGISRLLAKRRAELDAAKGELSEEVRRQGLEKAEHDLVSRIRNFFGIA